MSGIVGILQLRGDPVDERALTAMNEAGRHRGPDRAGSGVFGQAALAYRHLDTGHDNVCAEQPFGLRQFQIVVDGRIDNRVDVRAALISAGKSPATKFDTELIVLAYEQWGTACVDRLVGEFAFALWDAKERRLFCARDALGVKALYYYHDAAIFICASEIAQLLKHPRVFAEPNEGMVGEYLCKQVTSRSETLFSNIYRLPGGHWACVNALGLEVRQYWNFRCREADRNKSDADYVEGYLEKFSEAVRCRITDRCGIGFDLSGGMDSSSIVAMAQRLAGNESRFEAFSLACTEPLADEQQFCRAVGDFTGMKTHLIAPNPIDSSRIQQIVGKCRDLPGPANLLMHDAILESFRQHGLRVRLTGSGGDQLTIGDPRHTADLLRRLRVWEAIRQAGLDRSVLYDPDDNVSTLSVFARYGVLPLMPIPLVRSLKSILRKPKVPFWIQPQFATKTHLVDRLQANKRKRLSRRLFPTIVQDEIWKIENDGWWGLHLEWWDRYNFSFGLEVRHPFYDRRLVEFCLTMPEEQRWRGDITRVMVRRAMKGMLPESVLNRHTKGNFSSELVRHLRQPEVRKVLGSSLLAARGYVDQASVLRMYAEFLSDCEKGRAFPRFEPPLTMLYGLESWMRGAFA
jgi:asparagine synthase (glutamine-hydrolysing)